MVLSVHCPVVWWQLIVVSFLLCIRTCSSHFGGLHHIPVAGNVGIGRPITSSSTCGESAKEQFCSTTSGCGICDMMDPSLAHPADNMIDNNQDTWWQSQNNIKNVTIDVNFVKTFFFTYVLISFQYLRPAAMSLEKSNDGGLSYKPLLHYSADCDADFPNSNGTPCTSLNSQSSPGYVIYQATSTITADPDLTNASHVDHFTITDLRINLLRLHPLSGNDPPGPEAITRRYYSINHIEVYGWCFCNGHENSCIPSDDDTDGMVPSVCECTNGTKGIHCDECRLQNGNGPWSIGFSPSDDVCQECECNGHANTCLYNSSLGYGVCLKCGDNTAGGTCNTCNEGYYRNTEVSITDPSTCIECPCDPAGVLPGSLCVTEDTSLYTAGQCLCKPNVTGVKCDECQNGRFLQFNNSSELDNPCQPCSCDCEPHTGRCLCNVTESGCCDVDQYIGPSGTCLPCVCSPIGSIGVCDTEGVCVCKPGVGGAECDQCLDGYYNMTIFGCVPCGCNNDGSINNTCDKYSGQCNCRGNVEGVKCDSCPDGFLGPLPTNSAKACIECFCNGYSKQCKSESGWYWTVTEDTFDTSSSADQWMSTGDIEYNEDIKQIRASMSSIGSNRLVVQLPLKYFGDKRTSYGMKMDLSFKAPYATGNTAYLEILGDIYRPNRKLRKSFVLGEDTEQHEVSLIEKELTATRYTYDTRDADEDEVRETLSAIKKIKLVITFDSSLTSERKYVNISNSRLPYALKDVSNSNMFQSLSVAPVGEDCSCPLARTGSMCQSCSSNFTTDPSNANEFSSCVQCVCFGYADSCDSVTGKCINCINGTDGTHCELCADGYYRNPDTLQCLPCNCPGGPMATNQFGTSCDWDPSRNDHVCDCPIGFEGDHCETCQTGFVGNPIFENGVCKLCLCNQNSDGGVNKCNNITGDCVCDTGYIGDECHLCDLGYYDDPLSHNCTDCECNQNGSVPGSYCNLGTGQCVCHENVTGRNCGKCALEHWSLSSGTGCRECACSAFGAIDNKCDQVSGDCVCETGYIGRTCHDCDYGYWKMEDGTCSECNCQPLTSVSQACNITTGICTCQEGATGAKCDQCLPAITTGLLPYCELCDECSTRWSSPISDLELAVTESIDKANNVSIIQVNHTEIEDGRLLVGTLFDLLREIRELIQGSMLISISSSVTTLNTNLIGNVDIAVNLLERIEIILEQVNYTRMIVNTQLIRLESAESEFRSLKLLLGNLSSEIGGFDLPGFQSYISIIEQAILRSNESYNVTMRTIIPAVVQSTINLDEFEIKQNIFVSIRDEVITLFGTIEGRLSEYEDLFDQANLELCGSSVSRDDVCGNECGSVICDICGGGQCNGSVSLISRAFNISSIAIKEVKTLQNILIQELEYLIDANTSSLEGSVVHRTIQQLITQVQLRITSLLLLVNNLTIVVNTLLTTILPDIQQIGLYQNSTLVINISRSPEEVLELLISINETISQFPSLLNVNGTDLRRRADRALQLSIQANNTLNIVMSNITTVMEEIDRLRIELTRVNGVTVITQEDDVTISRTTNQVKDLLDNIELSIERSKERVRYLNTTVESVKTSFERNRLQLMLVRDKADNVTLKTDKLKNISREAMSSVMGYNTTVLQQLSSVKETLFNVTVLRDELIQLRNTSHTQMLTARGLLNTKDCIIDRQSHIRDDIHRIGADLERLHNEIEKNIARNTVCLRRSATSKK